MIQFYKILILVFLIECFIFILLFNFQSSNHHFHLRISDLELSFLNIKYRRGFYLLAMNNKKDFLISAAKKEQLINQQRKKLQEIRLQTQSQNTKLLKIQQKQRQVQTQYQNQKRNMEETLAKLSLEAQKFMKKQLQTTQQFENQKEQIFTNDKKKQAYLKQLAELQNRNQIRRNQILDQQKKAKDKKKQLEVIRSQIKRYQIYEDFLKEVRNLSDDFGPTQIDQFSGMSVLQRYRTMEKKKGQLGDLHKKIGQQKQMRMKAIQKLKKTKEEKIMYYNLRLKELKQKIDQLSEENIYLESQLQGKLNENSERQRELGQVIFSIRGLYLSIVGEDKEKQSKSILEMVKVIKEDRKKLTEYVSLFHHKIQDNKKKTQK